MHGNGSVTTSGGNWKEKAGQAIKGGCQGDEFLKKWPNWPSKDNVKDLIDKWKKASPKTAK